MSDLLQSITLGIRSVPTFPDDSVCPKCTYVDLTHPQAQINLAYLKEINHLLAANNGVTYIGCRCQDYEDRRQRDEELRVSQSNLPSHADGVYRRFNNFTKRKGADVALDMAMQFAEGQGPPIVMLVGSTGCGKSHLLEAIGRRCLELKLQVRYEQATDLLDRYRATFGSDSTEVLDSVIDWYRHRDVVLLDDLGAGKGTDFAVERLTQMVDERMRQGKRMAIATNLVNADAMAASLGHRLASRLFQSNRELAEVKTVIMTATDYRRAQ